MKKIIIASAAAVSMAALPFAGVFAAETKTTQDTVTLSIGEGCTMTTSDNNNSGTAGKYDLGIVKAGAAAVLGGDAGIQGTDMIVSCNTANGWSLSVAATALSTGTTANDIAFGAFQNSGDTSVWSMQLASASADVTIASPWNAFDSAKTSGGEAASGNYVNNGKITPYYKAYVKQSQVGGTYTGTVTYTFTQK